MSDSAEPRWELLPHRAEEFFELSENFDVRDLKRSYNRLIRQFKPELFPIEFQRIRAAYESLNDARRYNLPTRSIMPMEWPVSIGDDTTNDTSQKSSHVPASAAVVETANTSQSLPHERIVSTTPAELYEELKSRTLKSPQDYVTLALLADIVITDRTPSTANESFESWLFEGLSNHQDDRGLMELMRGYLCEEHALSRLIELLLRAVDLLPSDRFQYTTERAWDRLLREASFENFRDCLERCGAKLGRAVDHSQLVFYVHVLKLALWKADDDFLDEIQQTLEEHFETLDPWVQSEYELVASLLDYKARREEFVPRGPCSERIDQAIHDWCVLSEAEGDFSVLNCQYFLSMRGRRVLDEFPESKADLSHVLLPWDRIVEDVLDRLDTTAQQDDSVLAQHSRDFMVRILRRYRRTFRYYKGLTLILAALLMALVSILTFGALSVRLCTKLFGDPQFLSAALDGVLAAAVLIGGLLAAVVVLYIGRRFSTVPYDSVRRELLTLIRVCALRVDELANIITTTEDQKFGDDETIDDTDVIAKHIRRDAGIELFSLAQVCLSAVGHEPVSEPVFLAPIVNERVAPTEPIGRRLT